jgi:PKD repeat protein
MDQARSITATFEEGIIDYDLTTDVEGQGEVAINGQDFKDSGTYEEDTRVDLTAQPDNGYRFSGWEGDIDFGDRDDSSITVTMDQARSITATFEEAGGPSSVAFDISTQSPQTGQQVTFDAGPTTDDATISEYDWTVGEDERAGGEVISHTFEKPGKYTVTLTATDIDGYTESTSHEITVQGTVSVEIDCESTGSRTIACQATSDGNAEIDSYKWDLTDESGYQARGQEIEYTFDKANKVTASVTATGSHGSTDTAQQTLELNEPPNAAFTYSPENPRVGETISFNAEESTDNGRIVDTNWDLGASDPVEKEGTVITHTFDQAGQKAVEVTVQDNDGGTDTSSRSVNVQSPAFTEMTIRQQPDEPNEPAPITVSATSQLGNKPIRVQLFISLPDEMTVAGFNLPPDWSNGQSATVVTDEPLEPGESAEIGMNVATAANGTYSVTGEVIYLVGDEKRKVGPVPLDPVQLTVGTVATETAAPQTTTGGSGPGFGVPVTVLGVILLGRGIGKYR